MRRRQLLEFAVLGLLHESPMHGYELRRRLNAALGAFRALSFGTLYPCLRSLLEQGLITEEEETGTGTGKRQRIVYGLTPRGQERFQSVISRVDPGSWEDDGFDVRLAFFARTETEVRLRILEGRRSRLEERLDTARQTSAKHRERLDSWTAALQRHGEESTEREVRWLNELIDAERNAPGPTAHAARAGSPDGAHPPTDPSDHGPSESKE